MALLLSAEDILGLVTMNDAIGVMESVVREEAAGTTVHMAPFGGQHARPRGLPPARGPGGGHEGGGVLRAVGGGAFGLGRIGVRAGGVALVFDTDGNRLLAILPASFSSLRIGSTIGLAAKYLSRPDARSVGLLGSGRNALPTLQGLAAVRSIERVKVFSPNPDHRSAFADRAASALGTPVSAVDSVEAATEGADIIVTATSSATPVVTADHLRPGTHVTSMGEPHELDASVYLRADQVVASSWQLEMEAIDPSGKRVSQRQGLAPVPLWEVIADSRLARRDLVELGAIVAGNVAARIGPTDITVFLESQGGAGDIALANLAYERARDLGRGTEFSF